MRLLLGFLFCWTICIVSFGQNTTSSVFMGVKQQIVCEKNYPFFYYCLHDQRLKSELQKEALLSVAIQKEQNLLRSVAEKPLEINDSLVTLNALIWDSTRIRNYGLTFCRAIMHDPSLKNEFQHWADTQGKKYYRFQSQELEMNLLSAWSTDMTGIIHVFKVYGLGASTLYQKIDGVNFQPHGSSLLEFQKDLAILLLREMPQSPFIFEPSLLGALHYLELNGRYHSADFEPLAMNLNKEAIEKLNKTNWSKYSYSHILILGAGPSNGDSINPIEILRCRLAAAQYFSGLAPFIFTSGGRVHPDNTLFTEAIEMKKYLVNELGVPASAVVVEPHARHTTTNVRNTIRLLVRYHFPMDKPGIISTTADHTSYVRGENFTNRFIKELGYVPFKLGKAISITETAYYPIATDVFFVNSLDPLDP